MLLTVNESGQGHLQPDLVTAAGRPIQSSSNTGEPAVIRYKCKPPWPNVTPLVWPQNTPHLSHLAW